MFLREDWDEIKRLCVDELHDSYDDWLTDARRLLITTAAAGHSPEQVILRPADIRERERTPRRKVNGKARAEMVTERLGKTDRGEDGK